VSGAPAGALNPSAGPVAPGSVIRVAAATAAAAVCGYVVLYLAARSLGPAGFAMFAVFWGAFGLVNGAANGLLQEATREVRLSRAPADGPRTTPMLVAVVVGTAPAWAPAVFTASRPLSVALLSVGLAAFCLHATLLGMLAGTGRWSHYGALMVTDAAIRVLVAAAAFLAGWGLGGFLWATVAGSVAWLLVLALSGGARSAARLSTYGGVRRYLRGAFHSTAAAAASAVLVMGFPVLLKTTSGELGAAGGVVILAVTLTRAPLLVPLTALQGNLVAHFADRPGARLRALLVPAAVVLTVGMLGVLAAAALGPWLLRVAFGAQYQTSGVLLAWLTAGAVSVALLTVTGFAAVAAAAHRAYALGWIGATFAAALVLSLPMELQTRTVLALLCGPIVGVAVHLTALSRAG
jgi:O-antigen/teichoic acid export membrane protein